MTLMTELADCEGKVGNAPIPFSHFLPSGEYRKAEYSLASLFDW